MRKIPAMLAAMVTSAVSCRRTKISLITSSMIQALSAVQAEAMIMQNRESA